jgi:hypothetical protein
MSFKKTLKEIVFHLKEKDYFNAAVEAENSKNKIISGVFADKFYDKWSLKKFAEENYLSLIKKENAFPTQECHQDVLDHIFDISEYSLSNYSIRN